VRPLSAATIVSSERKAMIAAQRAPIANEVPLIAETSLGGDYGLIK